eukprot:scaffold71715_cov26-Tisochrysis_lutea.AAC.1
MTHSSPCTGRHGRTEDDGGPAARHADWNDAADGSACRTGVCATDNGSWRLEQANQPRRRRWLEWRLFVRERLEQRRLRLCGRGALKEQARFVRSLVDDMPAARLKRRARGSPAPFYGRRLLLRAAPWSSIGVALGDALSLAPRPD